MGGLPSPKSKDQIVEELYSLLSIKFAVKEPHAIELSTLKSAVGINLTPNPHVKSKPDPLWLVSSIINAYLFPETTLMGGQ